ncbi:MAG: 50S ribosomal protein L15 [bacterium]
MKLSSLPKIKGNCQRKKRRGRGAASHGRFCGYGMNGQKSRSGRLKGPHFEGGNLPTFRKIPMLKGFRAINPTEYAVINLKDLEQRFPENTEVTVGLLVNERLIRNDRLPVKILGEGELTRSLKIKVHAASKSAREKIKAAGASLEIVGESE